MLVPQEGEGVKEGGALGGAGRCRGVGRGEWVTCKRRVKKLRKRREKTRKKESRFPQERGGERGIEEKKKQNKFRQSKLERRERDR